MKQLMAFLCFWGIHTTNAQVQDSIAPVDVFDIATKVLPEKLKPEKKEKLVALLPFINYNPSVGIRAGLVLTGGKYFGAKENTTLSVLTLGGSVSTKGTNAITFRHNLFTAANKINFQGDWQISTNVISDYGLGTSTTDPTGSSFIIDGVQVNNSNVVFPLQFNYFKLHERLYKKIQNNVYIGGGIAVDIRWNIHDEKANNSENTPHKAYNTQNYFSQQSYNAIGLVANFQFNNREHPNQSRKGWYTDIVLRNNATWLGSTNNSFQVYTDIRKYISISKNKPNFVLAFWHLGGFTVTGNLPYLELPNTSFDLFNRSGRGYTFGRFRGPQYLYFEGEIRFPISRNNLISGVAFANTQTASVMGVEPLGAFWQQAVGTGLRVLLTKATRTNLCFDVALGGKNIGVFFGLNEAF